ncbi:MAG: hypothetical protein ACHQJ6_02665 [Candidatus Berkiellales bacterium]
MSKHSPSRPAAKTLAAQPQGKVLTEEDKFERIYKQYQVDKDLPKAFRATGRIRAQ